MSNVAKDFVTKNGIVVKGSNIVTTATAQTNALQIDGGAAIAKNLIVGSTATIYGPVRIFNGDNAVNTTTGALLIDGGLSVAKDLRVSGTIYGDVNGVISTATNIAGGTAGQLVYQSAANTTAFAGPGTAGEVLTSGGTNAPIYVSTTTLYVGRAAIADTVAGAGFANSLNGGLAGEIAIQNGTSSTTFISTASVGSFLQMGINTATFVATSTIYVNSAVNAQTLFGGTAGQLVYQSGAGTTAFAGPGTAGQLLVSAGTSAPTYTNTTSVQVGFADVAGKLLAANTSTQQVGFAANLLAGAGGSIPYQSAANTTAMLGIGANNSILVSNGSVPSWTTSPTIGGNVIITGNLTVQGTTTQVDSTVTNVSDPIITIGLGPNGEIPLVDDGKDRGIAFAWTGTQAGLDIARTGFFGFDRSTRYFTFITSASITNEVVSPAGGTTRGAVDANLAGGTAGQLVYQSAADTTAFAGPGTSGEVLISGGTGAPTYISTLTLYVGRALIADSVAGVIESANNLSGGLLGQIPYQLGAGSTAFIGTGTNGSILVMGANTATFVTTSNVYVNSAVNAQTLFGGTAGQLHYQSAAGVTAFAGPGTAGQLLVSGGTGAPTYTNTSNIYVGFANQTNNLLGGSADQFAYQTGSGATAFISTGSMYVGRATIADSASGTSSQANNLNGGSLGEIPYQTSANVTAFISTGTQGSLLQMGANTATFVSTSNIYVNNAVTADSIKGGTAGQLVYQSGTSTTAFAGPGTAGQLLVSNGASAPVYTNTTSIQVGFADAAGSILSSNTATQQVGFADVAGKLLAANTSTQQVGYAANILAGSAGQIVYQSTANTTAFAGPGNIGDVLTSGGTGSPTYVSTTTLYVGRALVADSVTGGSATANNLNGGLLGQIPYQLAAGSTAFIGTGTNGSILVMGANTASFVATSTIYVDSAVNAQTLFGGTAGQLVYQSGTGTTAFAGPGNIGDVLTSGGTGAPTYVSTTTLYVARAAFADSVPDAGNANNINGGVAGQIAIQNGTSSTTFISTASAGSLLQMGVNTATFVTTSNVYVNSAVNAEDLFGGTAGQLVYQSAAGATAFAGPGTAGQLLVSAGTGAPTYTNTTSVQVGFADTAGNLLAANTSTQQVGYAANLLAGAGGSIPYQSAANTTAMLGIGANNSILVSNGSTPSWTTSPTIGGNVIITGNLTVQGTTTQVDSTVTNVSDPIITIGLGPNGEIPLVDDGKDRGIAFAWTGTQAGLDTARTGFFGFDRSTRYFTFITSASITNEVVSPAGGTTRGAIDANLAGGTAGQLVYQSAADTTAFTGPGNAGEILTSGGTGAPIYVTTTSLYVGRALVADSVTGGSATANNLNGGALGQIPYQTAPNTTAFIGTGTNGSILVMGANTASFVTTSSIYVNSAVNAQTLFGGTAGQLHYQSAPGVTAFAGPGTAGQLLVSGGTGAPTYTNTTSVQVGFADVAGSILAANTSTQQVGFAATAGSILAANTASTQVGFADVAGKLLAANTSTQQVGYAANILAGTAGQLVYQSAANTTAFAGPGTAGQVLTSGGTGAPTYVNTSSLYVGRAAIADAVAGAGFATSLNGGLAGEIAIQNGTSSTTFISTASQGSLLQMGINTATFVSTSSVYVNSAVNAKTLFGGSAGQLVYQSGANTTAFAGPGTTGQLLISGGTNSPQYQNTLTVNAGIVNINSNISSTSTTTGSLVVDGGVGVSGNIYTGNRIGFVTTGNHSVVYQVYNPVTNTLDTVWG